MRQALHGVQGLEVHEVRQAILVHADEGNGVFGEQDLFDGGIVIALFLHNAGVQDVKHADRATLEAPEEAALVGMRREREAGVLFGVGELVELVEGVFVPNANRLI